VTKARQLLVLFADVRPALAGQPNRDAGFEVCACILVFALGFAVAFALDFGL